MRIRFHKFDFQLRFPNSISKFQIPTSISNFQIPTSISMRHLSNAYDIYGEFHFRISTRQIRPRSTLVANYKVGKIRGDTFGILGIQFQDFGILFSRYHLRIMSHFRILSHDSVLGFEYALDVIFDRSIIK